MTALLRFEGVALPRGGRLLFDGLDLALAPGEALHLTGPNGSGKSSLLRLAAGLLTPERGAIARSRVGLADDQLALDRELPLGRALAFWGGAGIAEAIDALGLANLADVPVRMLSSGQRKRATLARIVACEAPMWLLDEPLNGLDADGIVRLEACIERHRARGGAIIAASHGPLAGAWRPLELGR